MRQGQIGLVAVAVWVMLAGPGVRAEEGMEGWVRELKSPGRECSQAPFWFWNGELKAEELRGQVREMAAQGVFAAMPHPRFGMDRRLYLEPPYWEAMDATIDEAKKVGARVYLYDEYNWPSGGAGGRVTETEGDWHPHGLDYVVKDVEGPGVVRIEKPTPSEPESNTFEEIVAAFVVPGDCPVINATGGGECVVKEWGQISGDRASVSGEVLAGKHRVMVFFLCRVGGPSPLDLGSNSFVDYLNPEATKRFMELTHEAYGKRYGKEFGKTIPAIFTDEPQVLTAGALPWTHRFGEEFRRRRGYDLVPHLVALMDDRYPEGWRHRAAYWQTTAELFEDSYLRPIGEWCRRNKIAMTGHVFQETISNWNNAPHLMNWMRQMDWPGIDALGERVTARDCKTVGSVAHLEGKEHFLCESMGLAGGWNASLNMLRRGHQFLAVMGVDTFVPHAFFQTVENPRVECPPSFFFENPYWKYYGKLAGLMDRLCMFNRRGVHQAPVAVYYPIESLWADGTGGRGKGIKLWESRNQGNAFARGTIATFDAVVNELGAGAWDCDVADAKAICGGTITEDGRLKMGPERFECVVLPAVRTMEPRTLGRLDAFVEAGGRLVFVGRVPERCYPEGDDASKGVLKKWRAAIGESRDEMRRYGKGAMALVSEGKKVTGMLKEAGVEGVMGFVGGEPRQVMFIARRQAEVSSWLMINDGDTVKFKALLPWGMIPGGKSGKGVRVEVVDPLTGESVGKAGRMTEAGVEVEIEMEASEAVIVVAGRGERTAPAGRRETGEMPRTIELTEWTFRVVPEALEKVWTDRVEGLQAVEVPVWRMRGRKWERMAGWETAEYDDSGWAQVAAVRGGAMSMAESVLLRTVLPPGTRALKLPLPVSGEYMLWVNGKLVQKAMRPVERGKLDLSASVKGMGDVVAIEVASHSDQSGLTGPMVAMCGEVKTGLRSWKEMGMGWYAGRGVYSATFEAEGKWVAAAQETQGASSLGVKKIFLDLGRVEHYAEVWVNGKMAGTALWPPYRVEIGKHVKAGENRVVIVVANSIANRFAWDQWGTRGSGKAEASGLMGPVRVGWE